MMKKTAYLLLCLTTLSCRRHPSSADLIEGRILFVGDSITQDGLYVSLIEYELLKIHPQTDLISIGLSSETVSGLTEPGHPYPRPCLHDRLERALQRIKPKTVFACYGMNDGLYHPPDEEIFAAYRQGIMRLIDAVRAADADLILLTPPLFDALPAAHKAACIDAAQFGYASPYEGYNEVLRQYGEWLKRLARPHISVIDLNKPMLEFTLQKRRSEPAFTLCPDGVHPQMLGHLLMARQVLSFLDLPATGDPEKMVRRLEEDALFQKVHQRRVMRSTAWLQEIGYTMPIQFETLAVDEAEKRTAELKAEILNGIRR